ncbi:LPXTG-motif cell wall-anchored protein [Lactobacillus colini]|uniref:LPXTG-motif cell wall-anchored protein n=1 Tax=Lactobacillus colini TaxID=1819254 RepID=A0ABS4MFD1_9LACO|nr:YSIRK-type signal peptide-containing protein [Lactobacillus colini]MBP2058402.1 LPXTG-motif cell wall-anchored protein [Lactobacillus colini]
MLSKNKKLWNDKNLDQKQRFSIRKLSVGAASVLVGTLLFWSNSNETVLADQVTTPASSQSAETQTSTNSKNTASDASVDAKSVTDTATDNTPNTETSDQANKPATNQVTTTSEKAQDAETTTLTVDNKSATAQTADALKTSLAATTSNANDQTTKKEYGMNTIVSSDPSKISTEGYSIDENYPSPTLRPEAVNDWEDKFIYDDNADHVTFAVIGFYRNENNSITSFSTDKSGDGKVYATFFDDKKNQLGQVELTADTYKFANQNYSASDGMVSYSNPKVGQSTRSVILYSWMAKKPAYTGPNSRGGWTSDKIAIPEKVSSVAKYYDKDHNLIGTVTMTGLAGSNFTAPLTQTYDGDTSEAISQTGLVADTADNEIKGRLSDYALGVVKESALSGVTYTAVPGKASDYYSNSPINEADETKNQLKNQDNPDDVKTDGLPDGTVRVDVPGFAPAYIGIDEKTNSYRYIGTDENTHVSYYERNPFTGGTPAPVYIFNGISVQKSNITVNYVDDDNNGSVLQSYSSAGEVGDKVDYSTKDTIQSLENKGYILVTDEYSEVKDPTYVENGSTYTVHLKHGAETINGDNPANHTPDTPINPADPEGPKWPSADTYAKDYTYTVYFKDEQGKDLASPKEQTSHWTRNITVDKVTGEIDPDKTTEWTTTDKYNDVTVPVVKGYVASTTSANGKTVSKTLEAEDVAQKNLEDTVVYKKVGRLVPVDSITNEPIPGTSTPSYDNDPEDPTKVSVPELPDIPGYNKPNQSTVNVEDPTKDTKVPYTKTTTFKVVVHDKTTGKTLTQYGYDNDSAIPGDKVNYDWSKQKQSLVDHGYKVDEDPTIPSAYGNDPQTIDVYVEHDVVPVDNTENKHEPETSINPADPDGPKWPSSDTYTKKYTYTVNFQDQDGNKLADPVVQTSTWNRTVYVDKVTGEIQEDKTTEWTTTDKYTDVNVPVVKGYVASTTSANGKTVSKTLEAETATQANLVDTVVYNKVGKLVPVDKTSGKEIPDTSTPSYDNDPEDPTKVVVPELPDVPGYNKPNQSTVKIDDPTKNTKVPYTKTTTLKVVVHDKTTGETLTQYGYNNDSAVPGDKVSYDWSKQKQSLIDHGYKVDEDPAIPSTYGNDPQTIDVYVEHDIVPVDNTENKYESGTLINPNDPEGPKWPSSDTYTKKYTYTVNFQDQEGNKLADPVVQTSTWNRTVYVDKVTGEIQEDKSTKWTTTDKYNDVTVPVVKGYVASTTSANGKTVSKTLEVGTALPQNVTDTVVYKKIGQLIPVDSTTNEPIPGADHPAYNNDPEDPTKVLVPELPDIPGYNKPDQSTVKVEDPAKDTDVVYTKEVDPVIPDNNSGNTFDKASNDSTNSDHNEDNSTPDKQPSSQATTNKKDKHKNKKTSNSATSSNSAKLAVSASTVNKAQNNSSMSSQKSSATPTNNTNASRRLPQTGEKHTSGAALGILSLALGLVAFAADRKKRKG